VICGRGSTCYDHIGNVRFRQLVQQHLSSYMNASGKYEKTTILQHIIQNIRQTTPTVGGGFVKKDKCMNRYYEVGDFLAVNIYLSLFCNVCGCLVLCTDNTCFDPFVFSPFHVRLPSVLCCHDHNGPSPRHIERENIASLS
jgi:hypothetical protein